MENIGKIYLYDGAMGEEWTITDPQTVEAMADQLRSICFYDETPPEDPTLAGLSHQCLYYIEVYQGAEDQSPLFSVGLQPFYIKVGEEKFGPYAIESDECITKLLKLAL